MGNPTIGPIQQLRKQRMLDLAVIPFSLNAVSIAQEEEPASRVYTNSSESIFNKLTDSYSEAGAMLSAWATAP